MSVRNNFKGTVTNLKTTIENNKKVVLILMFSIMVLGIFKIFYNKKKYAQTPFLKKHKIETKPIRFTPKMKTKSIIDALDIYNEIKNLEDSTDLKKINKNLDKMILDK